MSSQFFQPKDSVTLKNNSDSFDKFMTGGAEETVTTHTGAEYPTAQRKLAQMDDVARAAARVAGQQAAETAELQRVPYGDLHFGGSDAEAGIYAFRTAAGQAPLYVDDRGYLRMEQPMVITNADGAFPILFANGTPIIEHDGGRFRFYGEAEGTKQTIMVGGVLPLAVDDESVVLGMDAETGRLIDYEAPDRTIFFLKDWNGIKNLFCIIPGETEEETETQQLTYSQHVDVIDYEPLGDGRVKLVMDSDLDPIGYAQPVKNARSGAGLCIVCPIIGQSPVAASAAEDEVEVIITVDAPMPGIVKMVNAGMFSHQNGHRASHRDIVLAESQYSSIVDAREGVTYDPTGQIASPHHWRVNESVGTAYGVQIATHRPGAVVIPLLIANGASTIGSMLGTLNTPATPWNNAMAILAKLKHAAANDTPGFEDIHGLEVVFEHGATIGFETGQENPYAETVAELAVLRKRLDEAEQLTGQSRQCTMMLVQPASAREDVPQDALNESAKAYDRFVMEEAPRHLWGVMSQYTMRRDLFEGNNLHPQSYQYPHIGEIAGAHSAALDRDGILVHPRVEWAVKVGLKVHGALAVPMRKNTYGVDPCPGFGYAVHSDTGEVAVQNVEYFDGGMMFRFDLAAEPGSNPFLRTVSGIEQWGPYDPDNNKSNKGTGRSHGYRAANSSIDPIGHERFTARPIDQWPVYQDDIPL